MALDPTLYNQTIEQKHKLKKGKFTKVRGANSRLLQIVCSNCKTPILLYQKDGIGALIRLYLDRIIEPTNIAQWQYLPAEVKVPKLICTNCRNIIGIPMIYKPENRRAIRLLRGSFVKKTK